MFALELPPGIDLMAGRQRFVMALLTMRKCRERILTTMFNGRIGVDENDVAFIDRPVCGEPARMSHDEEC